MVARTQVVRPEDRPPALSIVGEQLTVLLAGEGERGYEVFLQSGPAGSGPPPHSHPWDEAFFVLRGKVEFGVDEHTTRAAAGTLVHLPAGTVHWFRFAEGGAEMISLTSRPGAAQMFTDMARELAPVNPDLAQLQAIGARYGMKVDA